MPANLNYSVDQLLDDTEHVLQGYSTYYNAIVVAYQSNDDMRKQGNLIMPINAVDYQTIFSNIKKMRSVISKERHELATMKVELENKIAEYEEERDKNRRISDIEKQMKIDRVGFSKDLADFILTSIGGEIPNENDNEDLKKLQTTQITNTPQNEDDSPLSMLDKSEKQGSELTQTSHESLLSEKDDETSTSELNEVDSANSDANIDNSINDNISSDDSGTKSDNDEVEKEKAFKDDFTKETEEEKQSSESESLSKSISLSEGESLAEQVATSQMKVANANKRSLSESSSNSVEQSESIAQSLSESESISKVESLSEETQNSLSLSVSKSLSTSESLFKSQSESLSLSKSESVSLSEAEALESVVETSEETAQNDRRTLDFDPNDNGLIQDYDDLDDVDDDEYF
ncbi:hypothetical protein [Ligilactobacillus equi]|nr:hypothetical protein [Ligilactobacillus equi]